MSGMQSKGTGAGEGDGPTVPIRASTVRAVLGELDFVYRDAQRRKLYDAASEVFALMREMGTALRRIEEGDCAEP